MLFPDNTRVKYLFLGQSGAATSLPGPADRDRRNADFRKRQRRFAPCRFALTWRWRAD